jgi:hypothetical protein
LQPKPSAVPERPAECVKQRIAEIGIVTCHHNLIASRGSPKSWAARLAYAASVLPWE